MHLNRYQLDSESGPGLRSLCVFCEGEVLQTHRGDGIHKGLSLSVCVRADNTPHRGEQQAPPIRDDSDTVGLWVV